MKGEDPSTSYEEIKKKDHKERTRKELYVTVEFVGATINDKALAQAELADRDFWDRMKVTVVGSFLGVLFGTIAGLIIGCF